MLPKSAVVTNYLALEYHARLQGAILVRVEHHKAGRIFRFSFKAAEQMPSGIFICAPRNSFLLAGWAKKDDSFEVWQECVGTQVVGVEPVIGNRAMVFELEKDDEVTSPERLKIVFELFGAQATHF